MQNVNQRIELVRKSPTNFCILSFVVFLIFASLGTSVIVVRATDKDDPLDKLYGKIEYSLLNIQLLSMFNVDPDTGTIITCSNELDYEKEKIYEIVVQVNCITCSC